LLSKDVKMKKMNFRKLVKKLTVLDWLLAGVFLGSLFFLFSYFFKKETWLRVQVQVNPQEWWWKSEEPPSWIADAVAEGDVQLGFTGRKEAEVIGKEVYEAEKGRKDVFLWLNLRTDYDKKRDAYQFSHQVVEVGRPISLRLNNVGVDCLITWIEGLEEEKVVEKIIEVESSGANVWVADKVKVGDRMEDTQGNVLAEVLAKDSEFAEMITTDERGNVLVRRNPLTRDLTLKLRIGTVERSGLYYFLGNNVVKVGKILDIRFPEVVVEGALIKEIIE